MRHRIGFVIVFYITKKDEKKSSKLDFLLLTTSIYGMVISYNQYLVVKITLQKEKNFVCAWL